MTELRTRPLGKGEKKTGTHVHWRPDLDVFTDINIPHEFFKETLRRQAIVNPKIAFKLRTEDDNGKCAEEKYVYENGIADYLAELAGDSSLTSPVLWHLETQGRDRADKDEYKLKADVSFCVSNTANRLEY